MSGLNGLKKKKYGIKEYRFYSRKLKRMVTVREHDRHYWVESGSRWKRIDPSKFDFVSGEKRDDLEWLGKFSHEDLRNQILKVSNHPAYGEKAKWKREEEIDDLLLQFHGKVTPTFKETLKEFAEEKKELEKAKPEFFRDFQHFLSFTDTLSKKRKSPSSLRNKYTITSYEHGILLKKLVELNSIESRIGQELTWKDLPKWKNRYDKELLKRLVIKPFSDEILYKGKWNTIKIGKENKEVKKITSIVGHKIDEDGNVQLKRGRKEIIISDYLPGVSFDITDFKNGKIYGFYDDKDNLINAAIIKRKRGMTLDFERYMSVVFLPETTAALLLTKNPKKRAFLEVTSRYHDVETRKSINKFEITEKTLDSPFFRKHGKEYSSKIMDEWVGTSFEGDILKKMKLSMAKDLK